MKGELKAGGLALVYGLKAHTQHNGKCVTLYRVAQPRYKDEDGQIWWRVYGLKPGNKLCQIKAENLLPIDGNPDQEPEQLTKDKPAELTA